MGRLLQLAESLFTLFVGEGLDLAEAGDQPIAGTNKHQVTLIAFPQTIGKASLDGGNLVNCAASDAFVTAVGVSAGAVSNQPFADTQRQIPRLPVIHSALPIAQQD